MKKRAWAHMLGEHIEIVENNFKTRCLHSGGGSEPPLLLLHGIGGHAESYLKNMKPLKDKLPNRDMYSIDLIGHGYSSKPGEYLIPNYAEHVEDFLEANDHSSAHIHGESMGGWIATWIGVNRPNLAETIGLNTTAGVNDSIHRKTLTEAELERAEQESDQLRERTREMISQSFPKDLVRRRVEWLFHDDPPEEVVDIRYHIYQQESVQSHMSSIYGAEKEYFSEDVYEDLEVPTLIIHTEHNPGTPTKTMEHVHNLVPESEFHVYADAAHWPQWEQSDKFNTNTAEFIKNHS